MALLAAVACGSSDEPSDVPATDAAGRVSETALTAHFLRIRMAADKFRSVEGSYPTTVGELVDAGFLHPGQELDPWDTPYALHVDAGTLVITSFGADGKPGGDAEARDRVSDGTALR